MIKFVGIAVLVLVAAALIYASTRPDTFRVERSLSIKAPAAGIFPLVNDLHRHVEWSPWEKKDPAMQRVHSGAPAGTGAVYEWDGNNEIGKGRMEIIESVEPHKVVLSMHFLAPFEAHNTAEIVLEPEGEATTVTWAMHGPQPFMGKVMSLVFDMDDMIGGEFAAGLANLKALTEPRP